MSVCCECFVLSGRGLCDEPITRPEESYRLMRRCVWSRNIVNEKAMAHCGVCRAKQAIFNIWWRSFGFSNPVVFFQRNVLPAILRGVWPSFERQPAHTCKQRKVTTAGDTAPSHLPSQSLPSTLTTFALPGIHIPCSCQIIAGCCLVREQTHQLSAWKIKQDVGQFVVMSHTANWTAPHRLLSPDYCARFLSFLWPICTSTPSNIIPKIILTFWVPEFFFLI